MRSSSRAGFTLIEMILATLLVSIFFTMTAFLVPAWYASYNKLVNLNYARQIAVSVMGTIEGRIIYANDLEVVTGTDGVRRLKGNLDGEFMIPMEGETNLIEGLVYDDQFYMKNDISLEFDLDNDNRTCKVTVTVFKRGNSSETVLEKSRTIALVGKKKDMP